MGGELRAGSNGREPILLADGVGSLPLSEHAAIEISPWPGSLAARHTAHEAAAVGAVVVTRDPGAYHEVKVDCELSESNGGARRPVSGGWR